MTGDGARFVPWQLADDPETYGDKAGWWIVVSANFEAEHSPPFRTREEVMAIIGMLQYVRAMHLAQKLCIRQRDDIIDRSRRMETGEGER